MCATPAILAGTLLPTHPVATAGLLHTIMFHRALGPTPPRDSELERFNMTYVTAPVAIPPPHVFDLLADRFNAET